MSYIVRRPGRARMRRLGDDSANDGSDTPIQTPFFTIADLYENDLGASPNFAALAQAPSVAGVILKATQGLSYSPAWFQNNWPAARGASPSRYGSSWFRGCYHFGVPTASGSDQADYLLAAVASAGGWDSGDMAAIWDLEGAAWTAPQQVVDISSDFSARIKAETGKAPWLYSGSTIASMGITDHMGFGNLWTTHLDTGAAGYAQNQIGLWQYAGDGILYDPTTSSYGFPTTIPGWGSTDMSVVMDGGQPATDIGTVQSILTGGGSISTTTLLIGGALLLLGIALSRGGYFGEGR